MKKQVAYENIHHPVDPILDPNDQAVEDAYTANEDDDHEIDPSVPTLLDTDAPVEIYDDTIAQIEV